MVLRSFKSFAVFLAVSSAFCTLSTSANDSFERGDAFDISKITNIVASSFFSDAAGAFDPRDVFGGDFGKWSGEAGNGQFVFGDQPVPPDLTDWIEFETLQGIALRYYRVGVQQDFKGAGRVTARINLKAKIDPLGDYTLVDTFPVDYGPVANAPTWAGDISDTLRRLTNSVVAKQWRLEFVRNSANPQGCRVFELDGVVLPNPERPSTAITNLATGLVLLNTESIPVGVKASDPQGIDRVEVYLDDQLFDVSKSNFNFRLDPLSIGEHKIRARAVDILGAETDHEMSLLVVEALPAIELSAPRFAGGHIHFDVTGPIEGRKHVISSSVDGLNWVPVKTNRYPKSLWTFSEKIPAGPPRQYKAEHLPNIAP